MGEGSKMTKYLIITADDFGIDLVTNEAIEELAILGKITSVSLMIPGKAALDAVERIKRIPHLSVGLHVTLTSDLENEKWGCSAPSDSTTPLIDKEGFIHLIDEDGYFYSDMDEFLNKSASDTVISEIAAQYSYGEKLGITFDHLDSHSGVLYGLTGKTFISIAFHFCETHRLPFRFPKQIQALEKMIDHAVSQEIIETHSQWTKFAEIKGVQLPDLILSNPFSMEKIPTYEHLKEYYLEELRHLPHGITELFLHPSKADSEFFVLPGWQKRVWEYQLLMDQDFHKKLEEERIQLVSWKTVFQNEE